MGILAITPHIAARIKHYRERENPLSYVSIAMIVGVSARSVQRCVKRGYTSTLEAHRLAQAKKPPENYPELVALHTAPELIEMLGVCQRTLTKWNRRLGVKVDLHRGIRGKPAANRREVPEGFRAFYEANGSTATRAHFKLSGCLMNRLVHETGGPINPRKKPAPVPVVANDVMVPPPGYEQFKRKLGRVPSLYEVAA